MIDALKALPSRPKIYLCTPIPAFKPSWDISEEVIAGEIIPLLEKAVKKNALAGLIDLHTPFADQQALINEDGIHPTQAGARKMAEIIAKAIDPDVQIQQRGFWPRR